MEQLGRISTFQMEIMNKILSDFADINADEYVSNYYELSIMSEDKKDNIFELAKRRHTLLIMTH